MNYKIIFKIIGFLLMLTGFFMLLGIPFSIYYKTDDIPALLQSGIFTSAVGFIIWYFTRDPENKELGKREG
jgi:trk system potassium uptake protein TrkH